ncbi:hypothetical protein FKM82_027862, partial [Ascaphus truei]
VIIDVSAVESQGMEQHEYMDRARQYSTRLAKLSNSLTHWKKVPPLPSLTNQPHQILASDPVPFADIQQVNRQSLLWAPVRGGKESMLEGAWGRSDINPLTAGGSSNTL